MTNTLLTDYKLIRRNASKQIAKAFANITSAKQYGQNTSYQLHPWHNLTALQEMYQTISFNKLYQVEENQYCLVLGSAHERIYFWTNEVLDTSTEIEPEVIEQPAAAQQSEPIAKSVTEPTVDYVVAVYHSYSCPNRANDEPEYFTLDKWRETVGQDDQLTAEAYGCITSWNMMLERMTITAICCRLPETIKQLPQLEPIETTTKTATKTQEFTGTVTEARLVEATVYGIDYSAKERYAKALKVTLQTEGGQIIQFYTPSVRITINCPVGCPIAVVICEENDWIKKVQRQGEHKVVGENLESRLKLGDLVTVSGQIKASYNNGKSVTINYLKLIKLTPFGGQLPQKDYTYNSGDCITVYDSTNRRVDTLHKSLKWGRLDGRKELEEVLDKGHAFAIPLDAIERIKDSDSDPDGYWYNQLIKDQLIFCLGCWLDNRKEKPVIKKKVITSVN